MLDFEAIVNAAKAFEITFGEVINNLVQGEVANAIRDKSISGNATSEKDRKAGFVVRLRRNMRQVLSGAW